MRLRKGDKIEIFPRRAVKGTWVEWTGKKWLFPCGADIYNFELKSDLLAFHEWAERDETKVIFREDHECMLEQLIAEGAIR